MNTLVWQETGAGVWKTTIGSPPDLSPLGLLQGRQAKKYVNQLDAGSLPIRKEDFQVEQRGGRTLITIPLNEKEQLYGMGLQFLKMNQRGRSRYLRVNSDPKQDTGETHAPVPLLVSSRGYAVLVDTARIVTFHLGSTYRMNAAAPSKHIRDRNTDRDWKSQMIGELAEIVLPHDGADVYLFAGPTMLEAVQRYNLYCGGGTLPPKWGLGFWHRVPKLYSDEEAEAEAVEFRKRDIPCDVIGLEPGWHSRSYPVTYHWDGNRFPDPKRFLDRMLSLGFRVNLWEHPYVSPESSLYNPLLELSGDYTVWGGLVPDYTLEEARKLYMELHDREHVALGVAGYKLDECDGSDLKNSSWIFPAHASFPSGVDGEQMRQLFGLMLQQMTDDLYRSRNLRTYGLVRGSGAGASGLPYVLYSDLYDHRQFIRALCNASFCGLLWTPEIRKAINAEDWVRRMQSVCFSPLAMLNAWGDGTKPWSYPEVEPIISHYIRLRSQLLPYFYTAFAVYEKTGVPPFRAMPLVAGPEMRQEHTDVNTYLDTEDGAYGAVNSRDWDDQYMVGESLLVAPLFAGELERDVWLPAGKWYGLENGISYEGNRVIRVKADLSSMPLFVRDGAIIPMIPPQPHAPNKHTKVPLHFVHFGEGPGTGVLYDDDGETFDNERGHFGWWQAEVRRNDGKLEGTLKCISTGEFELTYSSIHWHLGQTKLPSIV